VGRDGHYASSHLAILWNGYFKFYKVEPITEVVRISFEVTAFPGENTLTLRGMGAGDGYGMMMDNITLHKLLEEKPTYEEPEEEEETEIVEEE